MKGCCQGHLQRELLMPPVHPKTALRAPPRCTVFVVAMHRDVDHAKRVRQTCMCISTKRHELIVHEPSMANNCWPSRDPKNAESRALNSEEETEKWRETQKNPPTAITTAIRAACGNNVQFFKCQVRRENRPLDPIPHFT